MSYLTLSGIMASFFTILVVCRTFKVIQKVKGTKPLDRVLFANNGSGCCGDTDFSKKCPNRYCFKNNLGLIVKLIDQSQYSVCLALYTLNLRNVREALSNAKRRGVDVRVLTTDESMKNMSHDFMQLSTKSGIQIRFPKHGTDRLLHHKFCIIDGKARDAKQLGLQHESVPVLLTGSMNWTLNSFTSNWDNIMVIWDSELVEKYQSEFDGIWKRLER